MERTIEVTINGIEFTVGVSVSVEDHDTWEYEWATLSYPDADVLDFLLKSKELCDKLDKGAAEQIPEMIFEERARRAE